MLLVQHESWVVPVVEALFQPPTVQSDHQQGAQEIPIYQRRTVYSGSGGPHSKAAVAPCNSTRTLLERSCHTDVRTKCINFI